MIRVNLLPRRREQKKESGHGWLAVLGVLVILEAVGIFIVHSQLKQDLQVATEKNQNLEASIAQKNGQAANHQSVKTQIAELGAREDAILRLQSGRSGPTAMLLEISRTISPRRMPTIDVEALEKVRRDNPAAVPNEKWDGQRVWLSSFTESEVNPLATPGAPPPPPAPGAPGVTVAAPTAAPDRVVALTGFGKTNEDVAEFLRRLNVSRYFNDVKLMRTEEKSEKDPFGVQFVAISFEIRAKVRY